MVEFASTADQIAAIAAPQGGYIHQSQLAALSLTAKAVHHRVTRGTLIPVYKFVYAVGHIPQDPISRAKGALLAAGPRSALADISAASYYGIFNHWRYPLHVTVPTDRRITGLVIHRDRRLTRRDILTPQPNLRVITPALALLQNAPYLTERRRRRVVNEIRLEHRIPLAALTELTARFPRHPGTKPLKLILATSHPEPNRSHWEDEWSPFAAQYRLPPYEMNRRVAGHRTDVYFPDPGLIVELDGWGTHQTHEAFIRDREQDAHILAVTGIPTVRITYERFHQRPAEVAARLHSIIERRRAGLRKAG